MRTGCDNFTGHITSWSTRFQESLTIGSNVENLRVGGNEECEDADPPLCFFYKLFSKVASIMIVAYGGCLHHLAAGSPRPGFCTDMKGGINEIYVRGGTGAGPPLVYLATYIHPSFDLNFA